MPLNVSHVAVVRLKNTHQRVDVDRESTLGHGISVRLRAARKKKRLNQAQLAAVGGVHINTQASYESGMIPPVDYLLRIGEVGIDWYWVLTGNEIVGDPLADDVVELVTHYRALSPVVQAAMRETLRNLSQRMAEDSAPS